MKKKQFTPHYVSDTEQDALCFVYSSVKWKHQHLLGRAVEIK